MTTCSDIDTPSLAILVDGNAPVDADIKQHLDGCDSCQSRLRDYQQLTAAVETMGQRYQRPPGALSSALSQIHAEDKQEKRASKRSKAFLYAAGSIFSAVALLLLFLRSNTGIQTNQILGLQISIERGDTTTRSHRDLLVGDTLLLKAENKSSIALYFNDRLVQVCPPECLQTPEEQTIQWKIQKPGRYQALYISATQTEPLAKRIETAVSRLADSGQQFTLKEFTVH